MKRALVFSGGGAKGSYEIGAWKAIRRLHIKIDIVTGSSIGSVNGALFAQNDYYRALKLWLIIKTNDLLSYNTDEKFSSDNNKKAIKEAVKNLGMPGNKAEAFLRRYIKEDEIRKSKIDFGIVTVNAKTMTPKMLTKEQIPYGKLVDYISASCTCFPAIARKEIDGDYYIDGGFYDNLPINLAIDMGADEVIAVDLSAVGRKQKSLVKDVKVDLIKNKNVSEVFTLDFTPEKARERIAMGYNDTMKYFKALDGDIFTFKKGDLNKNYDKVGEYYVNLLKEIILTGKKSKILNEIFKISKYSKLFLDLNDERKIDKTILESMEYLGNIFNLKEDKVYDINTYNRLLIKEAKTLSYLKIGKNLKGKMLIGYIYNKYLNEDDKDKIYKELFNIGLIFPKDFLAALYLISLTKKYPITSKTEEFHKEIMKFLRGE